MNILEWLRKRPDGLQYIDEEMQKLIVDFSLLWMYFEANYLGMDGKPEVLLHMVEQLAKAGLLDGAAIEPAFAYFRQRYLVDGKPSPHFADLKLANKWKEAVEHGRNARIESALGEKLAICLRSGRKSLRHAYIEAGEMPDQLANRGILAAHDLYVVHAQLVERPDIGAQA